MDLWFENWDRTHSRWVIKWQNRIEEITTKIEKHGDMCPFTSPWVWEMEWNKRCIWSLKTFPYINNIINVDEWLRNSFLKIRCKSAKKSQNRVTIKNDSIFEKSSLEKRFPSTDILQWLQTFEIEWYSSPVMAACLYNTIIRRFSGVHDLR